MNVEKPPRKTYSALALAGALPFVAAALLPLVNVTALPLLGELNALAASYGLAIASFMAGAHWGLYLASADRAPVNLFISSNAVVLFVWFAYLGPSLRIALAAQMLAFAALLVIDHALRKASLLTDAYLKVRTTVTLMVIASLGLTAALTT